MSEHTPTPGEVLARLDFQPACELIVCNSPGLVVACWKPLCGHWPTVSVLCTRHAYNLQFKMLAGHRVACQLCGWTIPVDRLVEGLAML